MDRAYTVVVAARVFALLAIGGPALWFRDEEALLSLGTLSVLWLYQGATVTRQEWHLTLPPAVEAAAVGVICALGMEFSPAILAALVIPPLFATATEGVRTMVRTVAFQLVSVTSFGLMWWQEITSEQGVSIFTWSLTGIGLSLIANYTFAADREAAHALAPYRSAQQLIRQLIDLSGNLSSGLEASALGGEMLSIVGDRLPNRGLVIYVHSGESLTPLASTVDLDPEDAALCEAAADKAWANSRRIRQGSAFALPTGDSAVITGVLSEDAGAEMPFNELSNDLASSIVKFETALLFAQFRDAATADERRRLAREMHDGVAQDIASLGYLVDVIAAHPSDEQQAKQLAALRDRVTTVVSEVRRSVMNLRTSIGENESLGAAISGVARHLSEASGIPVRVRLDEQPRRLRPEIEAELFRITQEAINNAVKHARATAIDVQCQVYAPEAKITITDNGVGLQSGRSDSHGLKIMRERARLIGAKLNVKDNASRGLTVTVVLPPSSHHPHVKQKENSR